MTRRAVSDWKSSAPFGRPSDAAMERLRASSRGSAQEDDAERRKRHSHAEHGNELKEQRNIKTGALGSSLRDAAATPAATTDGHSWPGVFGEKCRFARASPGHPQTATAASARETRGPRIHPRPITARSLPRLRPMHVHVVGAAELPAARRRRTLVWSRVSPASRDMRNITGLVLGRHRPATCRHRRRGAVRGRWAVPRPPDRCRLRRGAAEPPRRIGRSASSGPAPQRDLVLAGTFDHHAPGAVPRQALPDLARLVEEDVLPVAGRQQDRVLGVRTHVDRAELVDAAAPPVPTSWS